MMTAIAAQPGILDEATIEEHRRIAQSLVREAHANGGLAPVDLPRFWADQEKAIANPFGRDIPQAAIGTLVTHECIFDELGIPEQWYALYHDVPWRAARNKEYNEIAERIIGRRPLDEQIPDPALQYPQRKGLADVFEAKNIWHNESYWLQESAHNESELCALLDRVEARLTDLRPFLLPENWETEKARLMALGIKPGLYRGQRGPVTFATSVFGAENLIYLIEDEPELAVRFSKLILRTMLEIARIFDEEAGYTPESAPHGFGWADDNCCLMTPAMYELFAFPIIKGIFDRYSPDPKDSRYQHSDSAMGHLLPLLGRLRMNGTNFGPTVMVDQIRKHLPDAVIHGEMAPFTYSRNEEVNMVMEFLRDYTLLGDSRGMVFTTAGSINNGSRLTGMRLIMAAVQRYGRYDQ